MKHYKQKRGQLSFDQVKRIIDKMTMTDKLRRAMFDYFVHGVAVDNLGVRSIKSVPALIEVYTTVINGDIDEYRKRFLYTDEFNPSARATKGKDATTDA